MSDYISKQEAIQKVTEVELQDGTFADAKIKIGAIKTLNEKEIIRKAFERVVERLEDDKNHLTYGGFPFKEPPIYVKDVIEIIKEEGGIECMK